jgi:hypothetical protein
MKLFAGLAGTLFRALALTTAVGVLATAALAWFVAERALDLREAEIINERARSMLSQLSQSARLPLRAEMNRAVGALGGKQDPRALRAHGRKGMTIALRGEGGRELI